MFRKHVPDLDSLESPLISANPFGSILGAVPGSALAERIFNDPESWHGADDDDEDLRDADAMSWLAGEVEKCRVNGEELCLSPVDRDVDLMLKPFSITATPVLQKPTNWDSIAQEDKIPFIPAFEHTSLDLSLNLDLRLSKIWDSKGKMFQSLQSPLSPVNESKNSSDNARIPAPPALDLGAADNTLSPILSPLAVASASTTWSILEWYGVHPNTPRVNGRIPLLTHYPPTPYHSKPPALSSLRAPSSPSANATVMASPSPPPQEITPPMPESTPIRRLPIIPDPTRNTPSPTPSRAPTPPRVSSPERTPRRSKSPGQAATGTPNGTPNGCTTTPRRSPRGAATLPAPSGSPDPFSSSPNVTPIRSGNLFVRSPPAGPRPRSGTTPVRSRRASGRDSPSPIVIAPAPVPTRARKPTPPPGLRLGVPV